MILEIAKILENKHTSGAYHLMTVESSPVAKNIKPGQFLHIRCGSGTDPLLRRPLSPYRIDGNKIQILFKVVGKGTKALSEMCRGEKIDILGPLGNTFTVDDSVDHMILIGGGIGIPPLMVLAQANKNKKITAIVGALTKDLLIGEKDFKKLGAEVITCTDDGTHGICGYPTDKLREILKTQKAHVYACGPKPMLVSASKVIAEFPDIPCQVSMEEKMGCGVGVCLGCVIKTTKGLRRVCKDGPVFDIKEIVW